MVRTMRRLPISWLPVLLLAANGSAQEPAPEVRLLSPQPDGYVSGVVMLRASVEPSTSVAGVTFFIDGRRTCEIAQPPYECEWDAGPDVMEHQVRLVVTSTTGGRIVRTLRTRSLQFDEKVDVDAVQVTITVSDSNGRFIAGIPRSAFHVYENGKPQTISHFTSDNVPLELVTAVDISGSMTPAMPKLKKAVKEFLGAVPETPGHAARVQ